MIVLFVLGCFAIAFGGWWTVSFWVVASLFAVALFMKVTE